MFRQTWKFDEKGNFTSIRQGHTYCQHCKGVKQVVETVLTEKVHWTYSLYFKMKVLNGRLARSKMFMSVFVLINLLNMIYILLDLVILGDGLNEILADFYDMLMFLEKICEFILTLF